jgi:hypothetical protein
LEVIQASAVAYTSASLASSFEVAFLPSSGATSSSYSDQQGIHMASSYQVDTVELPEVASDRQLQDFIIGYCPFIFRSK